MEEKREGRRAFLPFWYQTTLSLPKASSTVLIPPRAGIVRGREYYSTIKKRLLQLLVKISSLQYCIPIQDLSVVFVQNKHK